MSHSVYTLASSLKPDEVRYVGLTGHPSEERLFWHLHDAAEGGITRKARWIRSVHAEGGEIISTTLESDLTPTQAQDREMFYISKYIQSGCPLTNATWGGELGTKRGRTYKTFEQIKKDSRNDALEFWFYFAAVIAALGLLARILS